MLCALKCDLREETEKDDETEEAAPSNPQRMIQYNEGLEVARKIGALRYLGNCSSLQDEQNIDRDRMLCNAKSRRQRGFYRGSESCSASQAREGQ